MAGSTVTVSNAAEDDGYGRREARAALNNYVLAIGGQKPDFYEICGCDLAPLGDWERSPIATALAVLGPGDRLVLTSLSVLSENPAFMMQAIFGLIGRGIELHSLEMGEVSKHLTGLRIGCEYAEKAQAEIDTIRHAHDEELASLIDKMSAKYQEFAVDMINRYGIPAGGVPAIELGDAPAAVKAAAERVNLKHEIAFYRGELEAHEGDESEELWRRQLRKAETRLAVMEGHIKTEPKPEPAPKAKGKARADSLPVDHERGAAIRERRLALGLSLDSVAEACGVSRSVLARMETEGKIVASATSIEAFLSSVAVSDGEAASEQAA
jgi:hypothetical protein